MEDSTSMDVLKQWLQLGGLSRKHLVSVCILSDVISNSPSSSVNCGLVVPLGEVGSQCCGHVQVLACDYGHVVYLVEREEVESVCLHPCYSEGHRCYTM